MLWIPTTEPTEWTIEVRLIRGRFHILLMMLLKEALSELSSSQSSLQRQLPYSERQYDWNNFILVRGSVHLKRKRTVLALRINDIDFEWMSSLSDRLNWRVLPRWTTESTTGIDCPLKLKWHCTGQVVHRKQINWVCFRWNHQSAFQMWELDYFAEHEGSQIDTLSQFVRPFS